MTLHTEHKRLNHEDTKSRRKYKPYPSYKDSGVEWLGSVPAHWTESKLKFLSNINMGQSPSSDNCNIDGIGMPFLQGNAEFGFLSPVEKQYTTEIKKVANKGEVLFSVRAPVGAMNIADKSYAIGRGLCSIETTVQIEKPFLWFAMPVLKNELNAVMTGSTFEAVSVEQVSNVKLVLPSLLEQTLIANFLDHETAKIDLLIEKQQQLIQLLKEKRQAVISHAVTKGLNPNAPMKDSGIEWLGEVPEGWGLPKLFHRTSRIGDGLHSTPKYQDNTGYYFVNGNNLVNGEISIGSTAKEVPEEEYKNHYVYLDESSVLLSINGTIGNVARYNGEKIILGKSAAYMNCSGDLLPEYLMLYLQSSQLIRYFNLEVTGTTIFNLSLNSIRQIKVCVPPEHEQREIGEYCQFQNNKYDALISKGKSAIFLMQERRTALISAAVTGKIDVRDWYAPESSNIENNNNKEVSA